MELKSHGRTDGLIRPESRRTRRQVRLGRLVILCIAALSISVGWTVAFPRHISPLRQFDEQVYFGNLHSHTSYSDGSGTPRQAYTHARDVAHLDFLALTEHNHSQAIGSDHIGIGTDHSLYAGAGPDSLLSTARDMTENGRFIALYGQEFSTISSGNHTNVFDIDTVIDAPNGQFDKLVSFLALHKDSAGLPAILMFNHPDNSLDIQPKEYGRDDFGGVDNWVKQMGAHARLIQMINGPGLADGTNLRPANPDEQAFLKYLNIGFKLAPTADQDNHNENWGTATPARTAVISTELTKAKVMEALRMRHVYATEDPNLKIIIKVNGHLCGDVIAPLPPVGELDIRYSISDEGETDAQYTIQIFRDTVGGPVANMVSSVTVSPMPGSASVSGRIEDVAFTGESQYLFFKIIQTNEHGERERAWTAPIWFQNQADGVALPHNENIGLPPATPPGSSGNTPPGPPAAQFVASRRSNTYHVSLACLDAKRIKPENRVTGPQARSGRNLHPGCPRTTGGH